MRAWHDAEIDLVVSLLTPEEEEEFELEREAAAGAAHEVRLLSFPIPDRGVPASRIGFRDLVSAIVRELSIGRRVAVHCRQGIGRAGLVAVGVLIAAGLDVETAIARVSTTRGRPVPETPVQRRWLDEFAADTKVRDEVVESRP